MFDLRNTLLYFIFKDIVSRKRWYLLFQLGPLLKSEIFNLSERKVFTCKLNASQMVISVLKSLENIVGKGENAVHQHFLAVFAQLCF